MRVLAVDPGEKRIGLAISDPSGMLARPLAILQHKARAVDAQAIAQIVLGKHLIPKDRLVIVPESQVVWLMS